MRVVSLACSNTEIVAALGCAPLLVGCDDHSDFPVDVVADLARVGPDLQVDPARVRALRPDLVLVSLTVPGHERVVEGIARAGLPHLVLAPESVDDVLADVRAIARALGVEAEGERLAARLAEELAPPAPLPADAPRVLVEWWPKPVIAPGRRSWVQQQLAAAGAVNPLGERDVQSQPLTDAEVRALDPDASVIAWCGVPFEKYRPEVVRRRPGWAGLRAREQVHCIPEAWLGRPGPRLGQGVRALRGVVAAVRAARGG